MNEGIVINNQVQNNGGAVGVKVGIDANRTILQYSGLTYFSTDTGQIWYYDGSNWIQIAGVLSGSLPPLAQYHIYVGDAGNNPVDAGNIAFFDNAIYEVDLGDFSGLQNNTYFLIRDDLQRMWAHVGQHDYGWFIDTNLGVRNAYFGAWGTANTNQTYILVGDGDTEKYIKTFGLDGSTPVQTGLLIEYGYNRTTLGACDGSGGDAYITVDYTANPFIQTHIKSANFGWQIDGNTNTVTLGDYQTILNTTRIVIDDNNETITSLADVFIAFDTEQLRFVGTALESATSSGNSGKHLCIRLNGVDYKIQLLNP